jgi:type II secretory pathway component PulC
MTVALFMSVVQLILCILSLFSLGSSTWSLKYFNWAYLINENPILRLDRVLDIGL